MTANVDAMVRAGVEAFRAGKKAEARVLLEKAIEADAYNEQAWLWLSAIVDTPEEQKTCLDNVLVINPNNERARAGLKSLGFDPDTNPAQTPAFELDDEDPFAELVNAADEGDWDDVIATSSSSSSYSGPQISGNELDNWVSGLNINQTGDAQPAPVAPQNTAFTGPALGSFSLDDIDDMFGSDDLDDFESDQASEAFGGASYNNNVRYTAQVDTYDSYQAEPAKVSEDIDSFFQETESLDASLTGGGAFFVGGEQTDKRDQDQPQHLFSMIPKEIEATRLPGEDEDTPILLLAGVLLLALVNAGAIVFMLTQLGGG